MWLPKKIRVVGHIVKILFPHMFKEDTKLLGLSDITRNRILIANTSDGGEILSDSTIWVTFFHELFHKMDRISGHKIFDGENDDEGALECFTEMFYQVLAANPKLREAIYKEIR